jgi:membrane protease YdiL (CAAX protease family)
MTASADLAKIGRMPSAAAHPPRAPAASPTTLFFAIALTLCTLALLAPTLAAFGVLSGTPERYMAGAPLAALSPTIAAVIAAWRQGGRAAVRALLSGLRAWRASPIWYALALALPTLVFTAGRAVYALVPGNEGGPWFYPPERPEHFAALVVIPLGEEIGWRGYALPRLVARHGAPLATAILSLLWALWHVPMFISSGYTSSQVLICVGFIMAGNPLFTWLYRRAGGSLLLAVLLHFGAHFDAMTHALPASATPVSIATAAYVVVSLALFAADRRAFEGRSPEAPGTRPALV